MGHHTSAEPERNLDHIAFIVILPCGADLRVKVIGIDVGRKTDFFHFDDLLLLFRFFFSADHLILIFAVINDLAHRRLCGRCDLHQDMLCISGLLLCVLCRDDPKLLSIFTNQTNFLITNLFVNHKLANSRAPPYSF